MLNWVRARSAAYVSEVEAKAPPALCWLNSQLATGTASVMPCRSVRQSRA